MAENVDPNVEESAPLTKADQEVYDYLKANWKKHPDYEKVKVPEQLFYMHVIGYRKENPRKETTWKKFEEVVEIRKKHNTNDILERKWKHDFTEAQIMEIWPMFMYGRDPHGRVIMWDQSGNMDQTAANKHFLAKPEQKEMLMEFYIKYMERVDVVKQNIAAEKGHLIYKHIAVFDMKELSIMKLKTAKSIMGDLIGTSQKMFPESLKKMYIINTGWFFRSCWAIISYFVDKQTQEKIALVGSSWIKDMQKDGIGLDQIPSEWGGKGEAKIVMGRMAQKAKNGKPLDERWDADPTGAGTKLPPVQARK